MSCVGSGFYPSAHSAARMLSAQSEKCFRDCPPAWHQWLPRSEPSGICMLAVAAAEVMKWEETHYSMTEGELNWESKDLNCPNSFTTLSFNSFLWSLGAKLNCCFHLEMILRPISCGCAHIHIHTCMMCVMYRLKCVLPKFTCWSPNSQYFRMWCYLQIELFQMQLIKMKSYWSRVTLI